MGVFGLLAIVYIILAIFFAGVFYTALGNNEEPGFWALAGACWIVVIPVIIIFLIIMKIVEFGIFVGEWIAKKF